MGRVLHCATFTYPLKRAIPSARGRVTPPSPLRSRRRLRNLERISIGSAVRLPLRARLTLIRLALIRNPWPSGVGVCAPIVVTYASNRGFYARAMLPYRPGLGPGPASSAACLMPDYYPRGPARLVSCYALFE